MFLHPFSHRSILLQVEDQGDKIDAEDRNIIRTQIVELMLNSPESLQKQVSEIKTVRDW